MLNIQIVLFDGFDLLDAIGPYEVFLAANMLSGSRLAVSFVSAEGAQIVKSGLNGPGLQATGAIDPDGGDILLIPGAMGTVGLEDTGPNTVTAQLLKAKESGLMPMLRQAMRNERLTVATVCGGAMLLAMDGLLENRYAVTHVLGMEALAATGAKPVPARVVVDGRLVTGGGVTSGLDVALYLIERELGPRISHAVETLIEYERRGTVWMETGMNPVQDLQAKGPEAEGIAGIRPNAAEEASVHSFEGKWDLIITTPVGKFPTVLTVFMINGIIQGTFQEGDEATDLTDPLIRDGQMTWSLSIKKPMRLHLKFAVTVYGDRMTGMAKAGMLPASKVEGIRKR